MSTDPSVAGAAVELHPRAILAGNDAKAIVLDLCSHSAPEGGFRGFHR